MITLKEIAFKAGVSITTVSNVINGNTKRVSQKTIERIQSIIRANGYVPNQAARSLSLRESQVIAVIVQANCNENIFRNPYTAEYVGALTLALQQKGYYPLIRFTDDYHDVERSLRGWNVAGAIFSGTFSRNLHMMETLSFIPCVFTDCYSVTRAINNVGVDDYMGGMLAARHLAETGHRRIAFASNDLASSEVDQHRYEGFRDELRRHGIEADERLVMPQPGDLERPEALRALFGGKDRATAVFLTADRLAVRLIWQLANVGLRVPEDVSVVGFDDLPMAETAAPPLTTISQNIDQKARLVMEMLLRHMRDKDLPVESTRLGVHLVRRKSVRDLSERGKGR